MYIKFFIFFLDIGIVIGKSFMVIGVVNGCFNFVGYFDEVS